MKLPGKPAAVIPTLGVSPWLPELRETLIEAGVIVRLVMNNPGLFARNGHGGSTGGSTTIAPNQGIYRTWNKAMDSAERNNQPLLVLNDDIELTVESVRMMIEAMRTTEWTVLGFDYSNRSDRRAKDRFESTSGTFRQGGLGGFAFCVDPIHCPRVDERFRWYYGDDDLVKQCVTKGLGVAIFRGCTVLHHSSWSANHFGHLLPEGWQEHDESLFRELWGKPLR